MIAALLALAGVIMVLVPGLLGVPAQGSASEWARLAVAFLLVGFVALEIGLMLLALPAVLLALHAAGLAAICDRVLAPLLLGGGVVGWAAAALACGVATRAWMAGSGGYRRARAVEAEPWLGLHEDRGDFKVVVLPTERVLAMSVPAEQPQVVISDGLVERLDSEQLEAVIRHEATHHKFRHWRYSLIAASVEESLRPLPGAARSARSLRMALEAWADEGAAGDSAAGRALLERTLASLANEAEDFCPTHTATSGVRERRRRLDRCPRRTTLGVRLLTHAPLLILGIVSLALITDWIAGAHHAAAFGGYCPD